MSLEAAYLPGKRISLHTVQNLQPETATIAGMCLSSRARLSLTQWAFVCARHLPMEPRAAGTPFLALKLQL